MFTCIVGTAREDEPSGPRAEPPVPDVRFSFANERTFLAWNRTALALLVAGLAITQLLPPFRDIPGGRRIVGIPLILLGGLLSFTSYRRWKANERALAEGRRIPHSMLPRIMALLITLVSLVAVLLAFLSRGRGL